MRAQLGHLSFQKQEDILTLLRGYEDTVFETRTMPRMPPRRDLYMDITETPGARPVSLSRINTTLARVGKTDRCASQGWNHSAKRMFV